MGAAHRVKKGLLGRDERGFTLSEVLTTIVLLGIVLSIAISTWFVLMESRRVDSAANQVTADLRLAHSSASNQLTNWEVRTTSGSSTYQLVKLTSPEEVSSRSLPDGTEVSTSISVRFKPDGSAETVSGSGTQLVVGSDDGSPQHTVEFTPATSRVTIVE